MTKQDPKLMKTSELVSVLKQASLAYREGSPIIDDHTYDVARTGKLGNKGSDRSNNS